MSMSTLERRPLLLIAASALAFDQVSKVIVTEQLADGRSIQAIPGLLNLLLVHNTGAAFSLFRGSVGALALLSLAVSLGLLLWLVRRRSFPFWQGLALAFLLGGTIGNGIDRWRLGYVIDFLALVPVRFPVFNVADVAINLAVICFGVDLWVSRRPGPTGS